MQLMSSSLQFCSLLLLPLAHNICIIKSFICHSNHACPSSFPALRRAQRYFCKKKINGAGNWSASSILLYLYRAATNLNHKTETCGQSHLPLWTKYSKQQWKKWGGGVSLFPSLFLPQIKTNILFILTVGKEVRKWENSLWIILNEPLNDKYYYIPDLIFVIRLSRKGKM